jgi:hypothetical protein
LDTADLLIVAIGEPMAPDVTQVPFALVLGLGPISDTGDYAVVNIASLVP